jgi:hypothetical protein
MRLKAWLKATGAAAIILLIVGSFGYFSVSGLKHQAELIVGDTLPGLSEAGAANASLAASHNRTLLFLLESNPAERLRYRQEIDQLSQMTGTYLKQYRSAIFEETDRKTFDTLIERREKYLALRKQVLDSAQAGQDKEALALFKTTLLPAYELYKQSGEEVLRFNVQQGQVRGEKIMHSSTRTQLFVAGLGLVLFIVGFLVGLFR